MEEQKFKPTSEWMQENYNKLNNELFDGELGGCILRPFTSGKGSQGNTLGWFKLTNKGIRAEKQTRRMFLTTPFGREYINANNFVNYCKPAIELNGNYLWSEKAMQSTLLHEMCHYYTFMNGTKPRQGHGTEFYAIGRRVSAKSNGLFPVERLASAEEMSEVQLTDDMVAKKTKNGSYIICFTLSKPYQYSSTQTYNFAYAKVQTKQALLNWHKYITSHAKDFSNAELYIANNLQTWSQLSRCNLGRYYLTNNIDKIKTTYDLKFEKDLFQDTPNLENHEEKAYNTITSDQNQFSTDVLKAFADKVEWSYTTDNYDFKPFVKSIKGVKVQFKKGRYYDSNLNGNILTLYFDTDLYDTSEFLSDVTCIYEDGNYYDRCLWILDDMIREAISPQAEKYKQNNNQNTSDNNIQILDPNDGGEKVPIGQTPSQPQEQSSDIIPIFRLKLGNTHAGAMVNNNNTFELRNVSKEEIKAKLQERFPKMSEETIEKLMNNPANYPQNENKIMNQIVEQTLTQFLLKEFHIDEEDSYPIDPNMNLGLDSAYELDNE